MQSSSLSQVTCVIFILISSCFSSVLAQPPPKKNKIMNLADNSTDGVFCNHNIQECILKQLTAEDIENMKNTNKAIGKTIEEVLHYWTIDRQISVLPIDFADSESFRPIREPKFAQELVLLFSNSNSDEDLKRLGHAVPKTAKSAVVGSFVTDIDGDTRDAVALAFPKAWDIRVFEFIKPLDTSGSKKLAFTLAMDELFKDIPPKSNDLLFLFYNLRNLPESRGYEELSYSLNKYFQLKKVTPAALVGASASSFYDAREDKIYGPANFWISGIRINGPNLRSVALTLDLWMPEKRLLDKLKNFCGRIERDAGNTVIFALVSNKKNGLHFAEIVKKKCAGVPMIRINDLNLLGNVCFDPNSARSAVKPFVSSKFINCYVAVSYGASEKS